MNLILFFFMLVLALSKAGQDFNSENDTTDNDSDDYDDALINSAFARQNSILSIILGTSVSQFTCAVAGATCDGCGKMVTCTALGAQFSKTGTKCTGANTYCFVTSAPLDDPSTATCTSASPNPLCDGTAKLSFPCTSAGIFPDPFFCGRYYTCKKADTHGVPYTCPTGYAFNLITLQCDIVQGATTTKLGVVGSMAGCNNYDNIYPVPVCTVEGNSGALTNIATTAIPPTSTRYFFICKMHKGHLYPYIYKCPFGQAFMPTAPGGCM